MVFYNHLISRYIRGNIIEFAFKISFFSSSPPPLRSIYLSFPPFCYSSFIALLLNYFSTRANIGEYQNRFFLHYIHVVFNISFPFFSLFSDKLQRFDPVPCNERQFKCGDGKCIPVSFACDGDIDCSDGLDENPKECMITKGKWETKCFGFSCHSFVHFGKFPFYNSENHQNKQTKPNISNSIQVFHLIKQFFFVCFFCFFFSFYHFGTIFLGISPLEQCEPNCICENIFVYGHFCDFVFTAWDLNVMWLKFLAFF